MASDESYDLEKLFSQDQLRLTMQPEPEPEAVHDLISDLPKNVIIDIMERLPLRTATKMSVLSKKWQENWLTLPYLILDELFFVDLARNYFNQANCQTLDCSNIVSKILLQRKAPILKFSLSIRYLGREPDITHWMSFLASNGIAELTLLNHYAAAIRLPYTIFYTEKLTYLKLKYFIFDCPPFFFKGFRYLLVLKLENIAFKHSTTLQHFIANCLNLEKLVLKRWTGVQELDIDAPSLKFLIVSGTFSCISLTNSTKLLSVSIAPKEEISGSYRHAWLRLFKFLGSSCKLERLYLRGALLKSFAEELFVDWVYCDLPITKGFSHVKRLSLSSVDSNSELYYAVDLIQNCPNLQKLNIAVTANDEDYVTMKIDWNHSCIGPHLEDLYVSISEGSNLEFQLIEFLLGCSPKLKNFFLSIEDEIDGRETTRKIKRFRKASTNIVITIILSDTGESSLSDPFDEDSDYLSEESDDDESDSDDD